MTYAFTSRIAETGAASGFNSMRPIPAHTNGTAWAIIVAVHHRLRTVSARASIRRRHGTEATSGRSSVATGSTACVLTARRAYQRPYGAVTAQVPDAPYCPLPVGENATIIPQRLTTLLPTGVEQVAGFTVGSQKLGPPAPKRS